MDKINPFNVKNNEPKNYIPTLAEIKTFTYSAWAKTVADVQTPSISSGVRKKGIVRHSFREVQKGKYINRKVKDIMNDFISKMMIVLNLEDEK